MSVKKKKEEHVDHEGTFFRNFKAILEQPKLSDVTLIVEGCSFPAHKVILAAQSKYFEALLFGGLKESTQKEIILKDPNKNSFKVLLEYLYTARMALDGVEKDLLLDVLELSHKWGIENLTEKICDYFGPNLAVDYLWDVYKIAETYGFENLSEACLDFADCNAEEVLWHESFLRVSWAVVKELLSHDNFNAPEEVIFERVCAWIPEQTEQQCNLEQVLKQVRLPLVPFPDILRISKALDSENSKIITGMIVDNPEHSKAQPRGYGPPEVNVASAERGAKVVEPDGATQHAINCEYRVELYTSHVISPNGNQAVMVELDREYVLNYILLQLWSPLDDYFAAYSYYIEVSRDQISWTRIVDYREFRCIDGQSIHFDSRLVKYVKVVGTEVSSSEKEFRIANLEACLTRDCPKNFDKETGFLSPYCSHTRDYDGLKQWTNCDLANRDCKLAASHDWHWMKKKAFWCYYHQPIRTSTVRIVLFDSSSSGGKYSVQISKDAKEWKEIGILNSQQSTPQILKFDPNSLTALRIRRPAGVKTVPLCVQVDFCECPETNDISDAKE